MISITGSALRHLPIRAPHGLRLAPRHPGLFGNPGGVQLARYQGRQNAQPLYTTPMVWGPDLNPEGAAERFKYSVGPADFFAKFGQFLYQGNNPSYISGSLLPYVAGTRTENYTDTTSRAGLKGSRVARQTRQLSEYRRFTLRTHEPQAGKTMMMLAEGATIVGNAMADRMSQPTKSASEEARRHRGSDPEDERCFGSGRIPDLLRAVHDISWLLDRGYGIASSVELAGDRYHLSRRQRIAVGRCSCSTPAKERRQSHCIPAADLPGQELWLDGFNILTAVETALGGGVILIGRDGCCRDVAGVYSHYHRVVETVPALQAIGRTLSQLGVGKCCWWLDEPVSNAGRLKGIILEVAAAGDWPWQVELVINPDRVLCSAQQIVCSSDHVILDRCQRWFNLARLVIVQQVSQARVVTLGGT